MQFGMIAKAFKFLIDRKAFDWAACANFINGDDKAEEALKRAGKHHYVATCSCYFRSHTRRW
jgi:hypothetical protein